jgi:hypothetical protein
MPTLTKIGNINGVAERHALASALEAAAPTMAPAELKQTISVLSAALAADDAKTEHAAKIQAVAGDPKREAEWKNARLALQRLELTVEAAAADLNLVTKQMKEKRFSEAERWHVKSLLARVGVID